MSSSSVDLNASIMYAGSLLIKPTVSLSRTLLSFRSIARVNVDSVVKTRLSVDLVSPVSVLNSVVLPADVYPANEIVGRPALAR